MTADQQIADALVTIQALEGIEGVALAATVSCIFLFVWSCFDFWPFNKERT